MVAIQKEKKARIKKEKTDDKKQSMADSYTAA